jgi:hypothetical protein
MPDEYERTFDYSRIDDSLRDEVDRRINTALSREKQELDRLRKNPERYASVEARTLKMRKETDERIKRILQWGREQSIS